MCSRHADTLMSRASESAIGAHNHAGMSVTERGWVQYPAIVMLSSLVSTTLQHETCIWRATILEAACPKRATKPRVSLVQDVQVKRRTMPIGNPPGPIDSNGYGARRHI